MAFNIARSINFDRCINKSETCVRMNSFSMYFSRGKKRSTMQVKLLENIEGLGEVGDIVQVKRGRMRNDLYPNKLAQYVLRETKQISKSQLAALQTSQHQQSLLQNVLGKKTVSSKNVLTSYLRLANLYKDLKEVDSLSFIRTPIGDPSLNCQIYGSVSVDDLINKIRSDHNLVVEKDLVKMERIKQLGIHQVTIELGNIGSRVISVSVLPSEN